MLCTFVSRSGIWLVITRLWTTTMVLYERYVDHLVAFAFVQFVQAVLV